MFYLPSDTWCQRLLEIKDQGMDLLSLPMKLSERVKEMAMTTETQWTKVAKTPRQSSQVNREVLKSCPSVAKGIRVRVTKNL